MARRGRRGHKVVDRAEVGRIARRLGTTAMVVIIGDGGRIRVEREGGEGFGACTERQRRLGT